MESKPTMNHDNIIANQLAGMSLEEAIFQHGYSSGYERGKREATAPRWVKCSDRMPEISKPPKLLTVKRYEAIPEIYSTRAVTAAQLADIVKYDFANFEWLDEQHAAGREEDAVALMCWAFVNIREWDKDAGQVYLYDGSTFPASILLEKFKQHNP